MFGVCFPSLPQVKFKGEKLTSRGNLGQEGKKSCNREDKKNQADCRAQKAVFWVGIKGQKSSLYISGPGSLIVSLDSINIQNDDPGHHA